MTERGSSPHSLARRTLLVNYEKGRVEDPDRSSSPQKNEQHDLIMNGSIEH